jgi:hypothetical protein
MKRFKIVSGGHVDLPTELAKRWGTEFVSLEDHDDHVILRPAPDEATLPPELREPVVEAEEEISPSLQRGSTGAGF